MFILHVSLLDPSLREKLQQVGVEVVGVPADMRDMFKATGCSYICFGEFGALFLVLFVLFSFARQN